MASVGRPQGFGLDPPTGSGRARGSPHIRLRASWLIDPNSRVFTISGLISFFFFFFGALADEMPCEYQA